jgi:probable HAF family extracellular repeat protein
MNLGTLGGASSLASDINETNQIVGSATDSEGSSMAFLYEDGTMYNLNGLVQNIAGWTLTEATAINDQGEIVGIGTNSVGETEAFLLTPIPEPSSLSFVLGLLTLSLSFRRKVRFSNERRIHR